MAISAMSDLYRADVVKCEHPTVSVQDPILLGKGDIPLPLERHLVRGFALEHHPNSTVHLFLGDGPLPPKRLHDAIGNRI